MLVVCATVVATLSLAVAAGQTVLAYYRLQPPHRYPIAVAACWRWDTWVDEEQRQTPWLVVHDVGPMRVLVVYGAGQK